MKPLTINIKYGDTQKTIEYEGKEPSEFISLFLKYIGLNDFQSEKLISDEDAHELENRMADLKSGKVKPVSLASLEKKIAARKK